LPSVINALPTAWLTVANDEIIIDK